jgi:hypothetical protein
MKTKWVLVLAAVSLFVGGCNMNLKQPSMNKQLATINGTSQLGTAVALDAVSVSNADAYAAKTKAIIVEVRNFLNTGHVGELTVSELQKQLNVLVPFDYQVYVNTLMSALPSVAVSTEKVGPDNLLRLNEALDGIEFRCNRWKKELRPTADQW